MDYVIPPPAPQAPEVSHAGSYLRVKYLLVDSRHRDHRRYPNANNYVIDLPTDFRDVTRIRLVQWDVPRAQATVRSSHATLAVLHHHPTYDEADDSLRFPAQATSAVGVPSGYFSEAIVRRPLADADDDDAGTGSTTTFTMGDGVKAVLADRFDDDGGSTLANHDDDDGLNFIDALGLRLERALNAADGVPRTAVSLDPVSRHYTLLTDFVVHGAATAGSAPITFFSVGPSADAAAFGFAGSSHRRAPGGTINRVDGSLALEGSAASGGELRLVGGTRFRQQLRARDWLYVLATDELLAPCRLRVLEVVDDTTAYLEPTTLGDDFAAALGSLPVLAWNGRVQAPLPRDLCPQRYVLLHVRDGESITRTCPALTDAVPTTDGDADAAAAAAAAEGRGTPESCAPPICAPFYVFSAKGDPDGCCDDVCPTLRPLDGFSAPCKVYDRPLGRLDRLHIAFTNDDDTPYDFAGRDHTLVLELSYLSNALF